MTDPLEIATRFVAESYPDATAAFLGGSAATGHATPTSDLDVLVIVSGGESVEFIETSRYGGHLVEAFVYDQTSYAKWVHRDIAARRYALSAELDDLETAHSAAEKFALVGAMFVHGSTARADSCRRECCVGRSLEAAPGRRGGPTGGLRGTWKPSDVT